ncbi:MAG: cation:proton antiporter [Bdellovibrionia bacterium]
MHFPSIIQDLAVILGAAALASILFQKIKQPVVLGYLLAGLVIGPHTPPFSLVVDEPGIRVWSELGVIFLMFSLGLEFSFKKLLSVGKTAAFTGPFEAIFMLALGFASGKLIGLSSTDSIFLGAILSISSTTIIIKALEELKIKKERSSQLIFGILVVEDLAGILILVALSTFASSGGESVSVPGLLLEAAKLIGIVASWIAIGSWLLPRLAASVSKRFGNEALVLFALSLCLFLVSLSAYFHYSVALGAFVMGAILGESSVVHEIEKLLEPIRDVFGAIFFVSIGMLLNPADLQTYWKMILLVTVLTIGGKFISTFIGAKITGQTREDSLKAGLSLAQIGEFSFIIAGLGVDLGVMSRYLYPVAVATSVITTFTTPYMIRFAQQITTSRDTDSEQRKRSIA